MTSAESEDYPVSIQAEAAAWLARLRSDEVAPQDLTGFRAWLSEDARHEQVFEQVTASWEIAGGAAGDGDRWQAEGGLRRRTVILGGASAVLATAVAATGLNLLSRPRPESFATRTGEQRRIALADGSTVTLDTDTQIEVLLEQRWRSVEVKNGRAHFQVATDRNRPFAVRAGDRQVVALGTAFDVSQIQGETAVLLTEGKVAVRAAESGEAALSRTLSPGERVIFQKTRLIVQDKPDLTKVTAWQTGRLVFDGEPLSQVVAEMNRYSRRPLRIADAALRNARISGIYDASDTEGFARSVSALLSASFQVEPDAIILSLAGASPENSI